MAPFCIGLGIVAMVAAVAVRRIHDPEEVNRYRIRAATDFHHRLLGLGSVFGVSDYYCSRE